MDPSVLEAIRLSVEANPDNGPLRLHYASLLVHAGRQADALEEVTKVLAKDPANLKALEIAADTAEATGDAARAAGYRRLHQALAGTPPPPPAPPAPAPTVRNSIVDQISGILPNEDTPLRESVEEGEGEFSLEDRWITERPEVRLKDVAGMDQVKKRLNVSFLGPMRNPEMRKLYGKSLRGGLMLYGPPGCGKTFIARAIAGELGAGFISIGLTDVMDMWLGNSEKNLHELFQTARRHKPCVIFMDEIDALGRKRSLSRGQAGSGVINQLLAELDGVEYDNENLFFLAATNHPWDVDSALRRPGRLDRMLLVLPPDQAAREAIIEHSLKDRPVDKIDVRWLATHTDEFSGADVAHLCDSAAEYALEDSIESGTARPITMNDFKRALKEIRPSTRSWMETGKNHAIYANEGGIYDDLLAYLRQRKML